MSSWNPMLSWVKHEKMFYNLGVCSQGYALSNSLKKDGQKYKNMWLLWSFNESIKMEVSTNQHSMEVSTNQHSMEVSTNQHSMEVSTNQHSMEVSTNQHSMEVSTNQHSMAK